MELRHSNDIGYVRIEMSRKRWSEDESGEVSRVLFFDSFMGRILTAFHRLWNFMRRPLDRRCQLDRRWQRFGAVEVGLTSGKRVARCLRRARSRVNNWFILDNPFRHCATSKNIRAIAFFPVVSAPSGTTKKGADGCSIIFFSCLSPEIGRTEDWRALDTTRHVRWIFGAAFAFCHEKCQRIKRGIPSNMKTVFLARSGSVFLFWL